MNKVSLAAALIGAAGLLAVEPASAQAVRFDPGLRDAASPLMTEVQFRHGSRFIRPGGGGFGHRGFGRGFGRPGFGGPRYGGYYGHRRGYGVGAGLAGLAAGAVIGGAIASQAAPAYGYGYGYGDPYGAQPAAPVADDSGYCAQRFKSYDPGSGTYLGYDGQRHPCP